MVLIPTSSANALTLAGTTPTAAGLALLDDADNTAQRTTLGLGTIATQAANAVAITGGTVSGLTSLALTAAANANPISLTGYSLTGSNAQSLLDLSGTWDTSGTPTLIKANVTNTNSHAASLLMDLQVGGISLTRIRKDGGIAFGPPAEGMAIYRNASYYLSCVWNGYTAWQVNSNGNFVVGYANLCLGLFADTFLARDAANTLALRNSTNAQTINIYNTYTSSTNNELYRINWGANSVCYTGTAPGSGGGSGRCEVHTGGAVKALTDGVATGFVRISVANDIAIAGVIHYGVYAKDDSSEDIQIRSGSVNFAIVNKAGGGGATTCVLGTVLNEAVAASAGTLTVAFTEDATAGSTVDILANAVSSLTETSLDIRYRVEIFGPKQTVTPL